MLEAASVDPDDAENAFDLQDAMCAVDYVIDTLAGFAVDEQAEADLGGEAMEAVGKSAADPAALEAICKAMADEPAGRADHGRDVRGHRPQVRAGPVRRERDAHPRGGGEADHCPLVAAVCPCCR